MNAGSSFPEWVKRLDPLLQGEETNTPYRLFRARRLSSRGFVHHGTLLPRVVEAVGPLFNGVWAFVRGSLSVLLPLLVLVILLLNGRVVAFFVGLGVWVLFWDRIIREGRTVLSPLLRALGHRKHSDTRMPFRVSDVYNPVRYWERAAVDLWLAGARGGEIAEALYLEHRERTWWHPFLLLVWVPLPLGVWLFEEKSFLTVQGFLLMASSLYMTWEMGLYLSVDWMKVSGRSLVRRMNNWVDGSQVFRNDSRIDSLRFPLDSFLVLALGAFGPWFFARAMLAIGGYEVMGGFFVLFWTLSMAFPVIVGLALRPLRRSRSDSTVRSCLRVFERADWPYNHFLSFVVMGDPAGADWAWRFYRELRRSPRSAASLQAVLPYSAKFHAR